MAIDLNNIEILKELIAHKDIDVISSILNSSVFNFIQNYYFLIEFLYKNNGVYFIFLIFLLCIMQFYLIKMKL